jgi:H2-forming N5,N10-methylenetetrahydromethanopterin dehydrogenase-like enzyme
MSNQVISRSKNALAEIERNDKELKNHSNPHARKLLEIQGLEKYKQTLAVDAMVRSALNLEPSKEQKALMAKADKQIAKLKKEITDAGGTIEQIELKNKDIMRHYTTWAENFSIIEHNDDLIAELVTDKGIARVGRSVWSKCGDY